MPISKYRQVKKLRDDAVQKVEDVTKVGWIWINITPVDYPSLSVLFPSLSHHRLAAFPLRDTAT